jgi:hypothetical protein
MAPRTEAQVHKRIIVSTLVAVVIAVFIAPTAVRTNGRTLVLFVDASAGGGDGTAKAPLSTIQEAVSTGRAATNADETLRVRIRVAAGVYPVDAPITVDYPVEIHGSNEPFMDADDRPTGTIAGGTETRVTAAPGLGDGPLLRVTKTSDVVVNGFTFETPARGLVPVLHLIKVKTFQIDNNVVRGPGSIALDISASSGTVRGNYIKGAACAVCIESGNADFPAVVHVVANRLIENRQYGLNLNGGGSQVADGVFTELTALVVNNDLSGNSFSSKISGGVRINAVRRPLPDAYGQFEGNVSAVLQGNTIEGNQIGVMIDAGFPYRLGAENIGCDNRVFTATLSVRLRGNSFRGNLANNALVTFTRNSTATRTAERSSWQYLHGATITIDDVDNALAGFWFDHPANDPYLGPCVNDATHEELDNTLIFNGTEMPRVRNVG